MSFFSKIKQFAGIGTLDVKLAVPPHFSATDTAIDGTLHIVAKSDQSVLKIVLELREEFESGRDDDKKAQRFVLGMVQLSEPFQLKTGESRTVPFSVPFQLLKSSNDQLKEKGGLMGGIGKLNAWANDEKSKFKFHAMVDVQGTSLDPVDSVDLKFLK